MDNGLRQLKPLPHASRVGVGLPVTLLSHADEIEHLMRALPRGLEGQTAQLRAIGDILAAGHAGDVAILFGSIADAFSDLAAFASDLAPEQLGGAGRDGLKLEQALHESALAGAVGAQQPDRPRRDRQVHSVQRPNTFVRACVSITGALGIFRRMLATTPAADKQIPCESAFQEPDLPPGESSRRLRIPLNSTRASYSP